MGPDDEDLFWIRLHASKIRERDEWEQDTGTHPIHIVMQPLESKKGRSIIPAFFNGMNKLLRSAKDWPTVVALLILALTVVACVYMIYGRR